jgi:hypothetical protein
VWRYVVACAQECLIAGSGINWAPVNSFSTFSIQVLQCRSFRLGLVDFAIKHRASWACHWAVWYLHGPFKSCNVDGDLLASGAQEFEVKIYPIDVPELADTSDPDSDSACSASTGDKEAEGDDNSVTNFDVNRYDDRLLEGVKKQLQQQRFIKARVTEYLQVANPTGTSPFPRHP